MMCCVLRENECDIGFCNVAKHQKHRDHSTEQNDQYIQSTIISTTIIVTTIINALTSAMKIENTKKKKPFNHAYKRQQQSTLQIENFNKMSSSPTQLEKNEKKNKHRTFRTQYVKQFETYKKPGSTKMKKKKI